MRRNICDIEAFDGVLSQYFSGLNSLDILIQTLFESDSFPDFRCASSQSCRKCCEIIFFLSSILATFKTLYGI